MSHPSGLVGSPSDLIGGSWHPLSESGDGTIISDNPARPEADDGIIWRAVPVVSHVDDAIMSAREAQQAWQDWGIERRTEVLRTYRDLVLERVDEIAALIRDETGKVAWEALGEAKGLAAKVGVALDDSVPAGLNRVGGYDVEIGPSRIGRCSFRPHGVMAVVGPFNFPAHLPNGQIVPALLMGNTVVFKPSDKAPAVGQMLGSLYQEALTRSGWDGPGGVVNVVQGGVETAKRLVRHEGIDGILFTGSWPVGRSILEANLDRPGRIVALEMGGNNAALVLPDADLRQAAIEVARCAFNTAGQRCTCTRRLVVHEDVADKMIRAVCQAAGSLVIGDPAAEHPVFMGPVISAGSREAVLGFQSRLAKAGGEVLVESGHVESAHGGYFVSPSVVRVDGFVADASDDAGCDEEVFGPLLRVCVVTSEAEGIEPANATRFGLAASVFGSDRDQVERVAGRLRAGCVNINAGTAGASSALPFGGLGLSGNHRPAAAFAHDFCAYPVAHLIESGEAAQVAPGMRFEDGWVS